ncbi:MAG TPA: TonB-dependent receptor [Steroidobacteraceae bacterium]|nr:TonB-dependent receptor [Steroidobacteraceae bacterium]
MHHLRHGVRAPGAAARNAAARGPLYGLLLGVLLSAPALAAVRGAAKRANSDPPLQLKEIIVTATRRAEAISKVPMSISAMSQSAMDLRGVNDIEQLARFIPGIHIDSAGTHSVAIRGIASNGGAGTTGLYIDDTPIQMRGLAFNADEALPVAFDLQRIEVLRGPQGTLFGAGSEGGTVRYITTPPSLTKTSVYSRETIAETQGGAPSYEAGVAAGTPIVEGRFGVRADLYYRHEGGYIDLIDPVTLNTVQRNANYANWAMFRLSAIWAINDRWRLRPSFFYQSRVANNTSNYWPLYSDPGRNRFVSADPDRREIPDKFYLPSLRLTGDFGAFRLIFDSAYYHRQETTGYEGTIYNLGFYQSPAVFASVASGLPLLLDAGGLHLPAGATNYRSPATVDNSQQNIVEELRLESTDPSSRLSWTTGLFFSSNRQSYLEQIHDPLLNELTTAYYGTTYDQVFCNFSAVTGACVTPYQPILYDPRFPNDSYFLQTNAKDTQYAWYGQASYAFTSQWKLTLGARESHTRYTFNTLTGGPQLFYPTQSGSGVKSENDFTPKVSVSYQYDKDDLYYATYAKGFRPGGANNPVPYAACANDFQNFGINGAPKTFNSDSVNSYEIGAKNSFHDRVRLSTSIYYIRWNNIQQFVVPPICQISFISNLGTAVAKGADLQAQFLLTGYLTADLTAGYTDARYTADARLSPAEISPIVASGDAITVGNSGNGVGTPSPPVTVSVGLQYQFRLFGHGSFLRVDDEYQGRSHWLTPQLDPNTQQYDSANYTLGSTNVASMRAGMRFGEWRIEGFVDNLTDTHPVSAYSWSIDPGLCATPTPQCERSTRLQNQWTLRPRTFGLTAIFRY